MTELLSKYQRDLALRGYSKRTCYTYYNNLKQYLEYYNLPADRLGNEQIKDYLYYLLSVRQSSDAKVRQASGALKYFYTQTLNRPWEVESVPQVKKKNQLPSVLSVQEVFRLLDSCANLKHKALLTLIYSSGLRVGEAACVMVTDIKREKKRLLVRQGKGAKDRYTLLSQKALLCLEKYWRAYRPEKWLFCGKKKTEHLSVRACQHAFYKAKENAGIRKPGGIHTLRHCFATHFLESGGGIFQLQKFLGHRNLKTTLIYAHVQEENITAVSPLDFYAEKSHSK